MKYNCILFYGDTHWPGSKSAGAFRIATELRQHGYTVQTIDVSGFRTTEAYNELQDIVKNFISDETLWVGFSTTFLYSIIGFPFARTPESFELHWPIKPDANLKSFMSFVRNINPNIEFIAGGSRKFLVEQYGFTFFRGNSDTEIIDYTNWLANGKQGPLDLDINDSIVMGKEFQDFYNSKIEYEDDDILSPNDILPVEISRGCVFKCKFCAFPMNGKTKGDWIKKSNILIDEFTRNYEKFGIIDYVFSDDTYNDTLDKVKMLHDDVFSKLPFKIEFTTYIRLDLMIRFPEMVPYLAQSGLKSALFGIETLNHLSGKVIGKGLDPMTQFQFIEEIKKNEWKDVLTYSGFMLGLPHDTPESLDEFEEFIFSDKNKLDAIKVDPLYIHPPRFKHLNRIYYAEFDIEHEKYGYECYEHIESDPWTEVRWRNHITGMNFDQTYKRAREIEDRSLNSAKFKFGGFMYSYYKTLGVPGPEMMTTSNKEILQKYNIDRLKLAKIQDYKSRLKTLSLKNVDTK